MCMLAIYSQAILKLIYLDWRPVFLSADFDEKYCDADYGKPSGHSLSSAMLLPLALTIYLKPKTALSRVFLNMVSLVVILLIMISRLYFAKHSINQLFLGFGIGLFLYVVFEMVMGSWLIENFYSPSVYDHRQATHSESMEINLSTNSQKKEDNTTPANIDEDLIQNPVNPEESNENHESLYHQSKKLRNSFLFVGIVSNVLLIIGVIYAKFRTEFANSDFFKAFQNCFAMKDDYDSHFSSKVLRDASTFNIFFGLFLAHFNSQVAFYEKLSSREAPIYPSNILQAFRISFDNNFKYFLIRLFLVLFMLCPILVFYGIGARLNGNVGIVVNIVLGLGIPFLCGYWLRGGFFKLLNWMDVPYFQTAKTGEIKDSVEVN